MSEEQTQSKNFATPLLVGALIIAAFFVGVLYSKVQNLEKNSQVATAPVATAQTAVAGAETIEPTGPVTESVTATGVSTFEQKKDAQICSENGKPAIYLFSTTWCPHCEWIKETFDKVAKEYVNAGKIAAHHWEIDTNDDTLTTEVETAVPTEQMAVYNEFNPGGSIPTFVFGCKYFRVGNGYESQQDLVSEEKEFRAAIDSLLTQ